MADAHPRSDLPRAAVAGTIATCFATAVGPMTAGVLGQHLPAPLHLSFVTVAVVGLGLLSTRFGPLPAVQLFSVLASVGCVAGVMTQVRALARPG